MSQPTLNDIRRAFFTAMQKAVAEEEAAGKVVVVPPNQEAEPDVKQILLISGFTPGLVGRLELGGYGALAQRSGIFKMSLSFLKTANAGEPWQLAEKLEAAFRPYTVDGLPVPAQADPNAPPCFVFCDFPYTEAIGFTYGGAVDDTPDGRSLISVTVPWWAWVEN